MSRIDRIQFKPFGCVDGEFASFPGNGIHSALEFEFMCCMNLMDYLCDCVYSSSLFGLYLLIKT